MAGVCHAWLAMCAPKLYRAIYVRSSQVEEMTKALSRPGSSIPEHAGTLVIRGSVALMALLKLLKLLPRLDVLTTSGSGKETQIASKPTEIGRAHV